MEKWYHVSSNQIEAGTIIFISNKLDSGASIVTRARQGHLIIVNGLIIECIRISKVYIPNNRPSKCAEKKW